MNMRAYPQNFKSSNNTKFQKSINLVGKLSPKYDSKILFKGNFAFSRYLPILKPALEPIFVRKKNYLQTVKFLSQYFGKRAMLKKFAMENVLFENVYHHGCVSKGKVVSEKNFREERVIR